MSSQSSVAHVRIHRVEEKERAMDDLLVVEEPLEIRLLFGEGDARREMSIAVTMRTPGNDMELALGFLFTEGIIKKAAEVLRVSYCETVKPAEKGNVLKVALSPKVTVAEKDLNRHFYISSSCGVCGKSSLDAVEVLCQWPKQQSKVAFSTAFVQSLPSQIKRQQTVFKHTGGIHSASLFTESGVLLYTREDIGRHNAVDKVIGAALSEQSFPLRNCLLMVSGRAGFELIQKAVVAGIGAFASIGAPSNLAVELAKANGLLLLGFVKEDRFNVYHGEERILINE
jgi:FdhD protein